MRYLTQLAFNIFILLTSVARFTNTLIAIDFVNAGPVVTEIPLAVVNVDFTIDSCGEHSLLIIFKL